MLTTALYFKHVLRESHKDCERPFARIGSARENPLKPWWKSDCITYYMHF